MKDTQNGVSCEHGKTRQETVFADLEDDGTLSYNIIEVCDNCGEYWDIGEASDNGAILGKQMGLTEMFSKQQKVKSVE